MSWRNKVEQLKGQRKQVKSSIKNIARELKDSKRNLKHHEQAREIIRQVGLKTQEQLQYHISGITSLALESVFTDDPYELKAEFIERRNKIECDLFFVRGGKEMEPMSASGGGAVDVASFALRIASWSMSFPRLRPVIIMDEPFRFLSRDHQEQASQLLKELSSKLGIQFIIVTHEQILTTYADRVFTVEQNKGISSVSTTT